MPQKNELPNSNDPDFKNLVNLLAVLSEATTRQDALAVQMKEEYLERVDEHRAEYSANQAAIGEAEAAILVIVRRHPEWFGRKKTLTTPYGEVKSTSSSKIDVPSEEASIRLIEAAGRSTEFIRTTKELDKAALDRLTDAELAEYGIRRLPTETIKVSPIEIDLGKAVADTAKEKEAA